MEPLLSRQRAAEHLVHALAEGKEELITAGIINLVGSGTRLARSDSQPASWDFGEYSFVMSGAAAAAGVAAIVTAPLEAPTLLLGGFAYAATHALSAASEAPSEMRRAHAEEEFRRDFGEPDRS